MAQPVPTKERIRRQRLMEDLVNQGFMPLGVKGDMPSAAQEGKRRDGVNYARWIRDEEKIRDHGGRHYLPNWIGVDVWEEKEAAVPDGISTPAASIDHASARAAALSSAVTDLITQSRYPVVNPDAILISSHSVQRYDRKTGGHVQVDSTPRTWLTDTLRVADVPEAAGRKYIFSGAQNDAPLHEGFWANLKAYAAFIGAEIVVGPWTYETSWWSENNPKSRTYAGKLAEHLCFGQMAIGENFVFCGEMNTLPTASQPISDLVTYSRNRWAVFPHAKRQLKSVPSTDPSVQSHQVMTTGAVTKPMIAPRKAGVKSLFHHVVGAVVVEFDETGAVYCRQITAGKTGAFYDLDRYVDAGRVTEGHAVRALVCGDLHLRKIDPANVMATFGFEYNLPLGAVPEIPVHVLKQGVVVGRGSEGDVRDRGNGLVADENIRVGGRRYRNSIVDRLAPGSVLLHDIFDHETRNHHNAVDIGHALIMHESGKDHILDEILHVAGFLEKLAETVREVVVVESNHDIGLERYVREGRFRSDAPNLKFGNMLERAYLEHQSRLGAALCAGRKPPKFSLLQWALLETRYHLDSVAWAYDGESHLIDGIECGHHGFRGSNGAKGTVQGFARTGRKMTIGDKHSPEINEGVYVAGVMQLQQGYNKGPSSWAVAHVVQYQDGNRTIITLQNGRWCAEKPRISVRG